MEMNPHKVTMSVYKSTHDTLDKIGAGAVRVGRGAVAGFIGGAIAAYVMNRYQEIEERRVAVPQQKAVRRNRGEVVTKPASRSVDQDPKVQVAQRVSRKLFDHELSDTEKKAAAPAIHYGYAATAGALYGGLSELIPAVGMGLGIPYATLMWLGGDEIVLPALGVTKPPHQVPPETHASALATHFVYGMTLDISRRILRRVL